MKLENWSIAYVYTDGDVYKAPETKKGSMIGQVYGHPEFTDGSLVRTSDITSFDGNTIKTRSGSEYELGTIAEAYGEKYPNARERLEELFRKEKGC